MCLSCWINEAIKGAARLHIVFYIWPIWCLGDAECFWLLCDAMEEDPNLSIPEPVITSGETLPPSLESNLRTTVASPTMNPLVGPIEDYITLSIVL